MAYICYVLISHQKILKDGNHSSNEDQHASHIYIYITIYIIVFLHGHSFYKVYINFKGTLLIFFDMFSIETNKSNKRD